MEQSKFSLSDFRNVDWRKYIDEETSTEVVEEIEQIKQAEQAEQEDPELSSIIKRTVAEIMDAKEDDILGIEEIPKEKPEEKNEKKKISKVKEIEYCSRYTEPKERGLLSRIINRYKYEHEWFNDVEFYLDYNEDTYNDVYGELEEFKNSSDRRDRRFYKRVQAYEDAEDDITMKRAFITVRVTAAAMLLAASAFAVKTLVNEVKDFSNNFGYVTEAHEKSTINNANEGQILYAENRAAKIEYNFEHITYREILDTIIRTASDVSDITESRARGAIKNIVDNGDQKILEDVLRKAYEEYDTFSRDKQYDLKQLIYEMLDEEVKVWIRSPEKLKARENNESKLNDMEMEK